MMKFAGIVKKNWFILGIFAAVAAGYNIPGTAAALNRGGYFSSFLVILLFFIQGLVLQSDKIISGFKNPKLHIYIQFIVFIVYPLYFFAAVKLLPFNLNEGMTAGLLVLACIPATIASSAVFTGMAEGNVSGSIFNAVLSNMAGVFLTPLIFSFLLGKSTLALPLDMLIDVLAGLVIRILLPMAAGMIIRRYTAQFIDRYRKIFTIISSLAILFIVFIAFAGSSNTLDRNLLSSLYPVFLFLMVTYLLFTFFIYKSAVKLGFGREDVIASVFTASQKTLAMGVPLVTLYFMDNPEALGIILIPLLFYHPWQLLVSSFMVNFFLRKSRS